MHLIVGWLVVRHLYSKHGALGFVYWGSTSALLLLYLVSGVWAVLRLGGVYSVEFTEHSVILCFWPPGDGFGMVGLWHTGLSTHYTKWKTIVADRCTTFNAHTSDVPSAEAWIEKRK